MKQPHHWYCLTSSRQQPGLVLSQWHALVPHDVTRSGLVLDTHDRVLGIGFPNVVDIRIIFAYNPIVIYSYTDYQLKSIQLMLIESEKDQLIKQNLSQ